MCIFVKKSNGINNFLMVHTFQPSYKAPSLWKGFQVKFSVFPWHIMEVFLSPWKRRARETREILKLLLSLWSDFKISLVPRALLFHGLVFLGSFYIFSTCLVQHSTWLCLLQCTLESTISPKFELFVYLASKQYLTTQPLRFAKDD